MSRVTIGVDVGGTKIAAGVVDGHGTILRTARRPTPRHDSAPYWQKWRTSSTSASRCRRNGHRLRVSALPAASIIPSLVYFAPNLAWTHVPVRTVLEAATGLACVVENDGEAAAWAERVSARASGSSTWSW